MDAGGYMAQPVPAAVFERIKLRRGGGRAIFAACKFLSIIFTDVDEQLVI